MAVKQSTLFNKTNIIHIFVWHLLCHEDYIYKCIMYILQDYSVLYNNVVRSVICMWGLGTVHYLPVGMDLYMDICSYQKYLCPSILFSKKSLCPALVCLKKVVTLPINLIVYKYNIVNILCIKFYVWKKLSTEKNRCLSLSTMTVEWDVLKD